MKLFITSIFLLSIGLLHSQLADFPLVNLQKITTTESCTSNFNSKDSNTLVVLWSTTERHGMIELDELMKISDTWKNQFHLNIVAIAVEESSKRGKTNSFILSKGWKFDFYMDTDANLMTALDGQNIPITILLDEHNKIVWRQDGFELGDIDNINNALTQLK